MGRFHGSLGMLRGAIVVVAPSIPLTLHSGPPKSWQIADACFELGLRPANRSDDFGGQAGSVNRDLCQSSSGALTYETARTPLTMAPPSTLVSRMRAPVVFAAQTVWTLKPSSDGRRTRRQCSPRWAWRWSRTSQQ